ncbi:virulence RhuM family protein [Candidatus Margulisiibacteriota bacterium]
MENNKDIIVYKSEDGKVSFDVKLTQDTIWLTQSQIAELFDKNRVTITDHINNVFIEGELNKDSVCRKFLHTAKDGKKYETQFYNLDVIISVGYRVKSKRGTQFRIWATQVLKDHLLNGYSVNRHKIEIIEKQMDTIIKKMENNQTVIDVEIKQLREDQEFIKRMAEPAQIVNKIYIDNRSTSF